MCAVLAVSLALCLFSLFFQQRTLEGLDRMRSEAVSLINAGDRAGAEEKITQLADSFENRSKILEMIASHNDLHDAYLHIVGAKISLELRDLDDTSKELALLGETLSHLRQHEAFTISNIY
jgi:hypothetical protein